MLEPKTGRGQRIYILLYSDMLVLSFVPEIGLSMQMCVPFIYRKSLAVTASEQILLYHLLLKLFPVSETHLSENPVAIGRSVRFGEETAMMTWLSQDSISVEEFM